MMAHRIKIAASVATTAFSFFTLKTIKSTYSGNPQPEKNQESSPKLPENFKYDGSQRIIR